MKPYLSLGKLLVVLALALMSLSTPLAHGSWNPFKKRKPEMSLDQGLANAVAGQEAKFVGVDGHVFHIKPITVNRHGTRVTINGTISHHLANRPDDQIAYTIVKDGAKIADVSVSIDRGGLASIVGLGSAEIAELFRAGGKLFDGSWEGACRRIIASVSATV